MAIQGVHRTDLYFSALPQAPLASYAKAEQSCGLQSCFWTVCNAISVFARCFFRALCYCCCTEEKSGHDVPKTLPQTPLLAKSRLQLSTFEGLDLRPMPCLDVMLRTFNHCDVKEAFPVMAQVCKAWNRVLQEVCVLQLQRAKCLTLEELFIYQTRLRGRPDGNLLPTDWECIFKHCGQLEALDFSGAFQNTLNLVRSDRRKGHQREMIRALEIVGIVRAAAQSCPHFKILDFSVYENPGEWGDYEDLKSQEFSKCCTVAQVIWHALGHVPKLTHLKLRRCPLDIIFAFVQRFPELVSLDFNSSRHPKKEVTEVYRCNFIAKIGEYCPKLRRLAIDGLQGGLFASGKAYQAQGLAFLVQKFPCLTHLSIDEEVTREGQYTLAENCKHLVFFQCKSKKFEWQDKDLESFKQKYPKIAISTRFLEGNDSIFLDEDAQKVITKL
jgi:hypothetical protein